MRTALLLLALLAAPAGADPLAEIVCAPTPEMAQRLETQYGTDRVAAGLRGPEETMELWTDPRGDWAMVVRYARGLSCIVAMGEAWESYAAADG